MNFRKVMLILVMAFIIMSFLAIDQIQAADRDFSKNSSRNFVNARGDSNIFSYIITARHNNEKTNQVGQENRRSHENKKSFGVRHRPEHSTIIKAILDYDDYTHIFRLYENKE